MNCGYYDLQLTDDKHALSFGCKVLYPTHDPKDRLSFGPYVIEARQFAAIADERYPLAIISHGNGGTALVYRNIATHLASKGYIVAMPEHYGNNRQDNSLADSADNLILRPYHIHLIIEALAGHENFAKHVLTDNTAVIGHSFGGYTALAIAGGNPYTKDGRALEVQHDQRVKSIVLMAPAAGWFYPEGALHNVFAPVSLWMGELDQITPPQWSSEIVLNGLLDKNKIEHHVVPRAGHFSFLTPFPESMKGPTFPPSTDPDGFNREEFHSRFPSMIEDFLKRSM